MKTFSAKKLRGSVLFLAGLFSSAVVAQQLPDFTDLVSENSAGVVNVSTTQSISRESLPRDFEIPDLPEGSPYHDFFERFLDELPEHRRNTQSLGSGFVISGDGYILTSVHVIKDASEIVVRFNDRREFEAEVVGLDERSDVALLKVPASDLQVVEIGDPAALDVGEWVLAIGSPFGFESTATAGIVSAKGRSLPNENYVPFIQTDVAINPGNSGGPLFNLDGQVVGINAQIYSRTGGFMGLSFAVPIDIAMEVADQLKTKGRVTRGWLGALIQSVTRNLAESFGMPKPVGALIAEVVPGSPAAHSELKPGDVIVEYNGERLDEMSDLPPRVGATPVGEEAELEIIRDGKRKTVTVVIGELPVKGTEAERGAEDDSDDLVLGMRLETVQEEDQEELQVDHGVKVMEIVDGPARDAGIQPGDVLLQIKGEKIANVDQVRELAGDLPDDKSVPVLVKRGARSLFLALKPPGNSSENGVTQ
ncbi:MAG: Periplasmic serine endoprotease DegP [Gammaproteobacteria bacterium]|nr:Periplasmic serine endoprotease DegP [Gammaproteobacteria bacterium]